MADNRGFSIFLKYIIVVLVITCIAAAVSAWLLRKNLRQKVIRETSLTTPNGIDSLEKIVLGGVEQYILLRGTDTSHPVLLHLHGGPGAADISIARHFDTELVKHFVVVHWDQRGAGKSYNPEIPPESMTRERIVTDVLELAEMLRTRFEAEKIYLVGHSWGSEIGVLAVARRPELFYAYVGVGQVAHDLEAETISYNYALDRAIEAGNEKAVRELKEIGLPPYDEHQEIVTQRKWLARLGGVTHQELDFNDLLKIGLTSPDYSLMDGIRFFRGQNFSANALWEEAADTNLFEEVPELEVPVYFFLGKYDYNTPFEVAERYFEELDAPEGKQLIWFEEAGHMIPYESPEEYQAQLIDTVLKETFDRSG
jgi:pimeloyl-ACP methyl ester carboxylesterase